MPALVVISTLDGGRRNEALRLPAPELASKLGLFRSSAAIVPASTLARTRAPSGTLMRPCTRQRSVRRRGSGQRLTIQRTPFSKRCRRLGGRPDQRSSTAAAATSPVAASRSSRPLSKSTTISLAPGARTRRVAAPAAGPAVPADPPAAARASWPAGPAAGAATRRWLTALARAVARASTAVTAASATAIASRRPLRPARPDAPPPGVPTLSVAPPTLSMAMLVRSAEGYAHVRHS